MRRSLRAESFKRILDHLVGHASLSLLLSAVYLLFFGFLQNVQQHFVAHVLDLVLEPVLINRQTFGRQDDRHLWKQFLGRRMCFRLTVVPQLVKRLKGSFALLDFKLGIGDQEVRLTDVHSFLLK